jgi:electron transport complex protein RnfB
MSSGVIPVRVDDIDDWLPQTQCTRCGYPDCRSYAEAVARRDTDINRCPPGGTITIRALAGLFGIAEKALDPECGVHEPRLLARIIESECIGCRLCIDACPVDAIVGAAKRMHSVIARDCTGCELCVEPCPVDCIELVPPPPTDGRGERWPEYPPDLVRRARQRAARRRERAVRQAAAYARARKRGNDRRRMREEILAAVRRTRRRRDRLSIASDGDPR